MNDYFRLHSENLRIDTESRGVATALFRNRWFCPPHFFAPRPIFPPTFSDLLHRFEGTNIQPITRWVISWARLPWALNLSLLSTFIRSFFHSFIHSSIPSLLCSLAVWGKMPPPPIEIDYTIHAIKFPWYNWTYCNAASGLYSACICGWKLLRVVSVFALREL